MKTLFFVGLGGFAGSILRYTVSNWVQKAFSFFHLPLGTLAVNMLGCLIIGFMFGWSEHIKVLTTEQRLFIITGVLGSFTTFSTFGNDTLILMRNHHLAPALLNVFIHVIIGVSAVWLGFKLSALRV